MHIYVSTVQKVIGRTDRGTGQVYNSHYVCNLFLGLVTGHIQRAIVS